MHISQQSQTTPRTVPPQQESAPRATPQASTAPRVLSGALLRLTLADLAYFSAAGVAIYTLPVFVTGPLGSGRAGAGLAFGAFAVTALVLRPFAGRLSDRLGRRPLLVGGAALAAVALLLTGFVDHLGLVVALRLVLGVAEATFMVASFATVADLAPPGQMGRALSYNSLGLYVGLAAGPPLGELLVTGLGYRAAWTGAAVFAVLATLLVRRLPETRTPSQAEVAPNPPLIHRPSIPPALGFLASTIAMSAFLAFAALHAGAVGLGRASLPLTVYGLVVVLGRISFARWMDAGDPHRLAAAALVVMTAGLGLAASWQAPAGLLVGAGPIVLGLVAESLGLSWVFGAGAAVALVGGAWTLALATRPRR